jgi:hypothetical protein
MSIGFGMHGQIPRARCSSVVSMGPLTTIRVSGLADAHASTRPRDTRDLAVERVHCSPEFINFPITLMTL